MYLLFYNIISLRDLKKKKKKQTIYPNRKKSLKNKIPIIRQYKYFVYFTNFDNFFIINLVLWQHEVLFHLRFYILCMIFHFET